MQAPAWATGGSPGASVRWRSARLHALRIGTGRAAPAAAPRAAPTSAASPCAPASTSSAAAATPAAHTVRRAARRRGEYSRRPVGGSAAPTAASAASVASAHTRGWDAWSRSLRMPARAAWPEARSSWPSAAGASDLRRHCIHGRNVVVQQAKPRRKAGDEHCGARGEGAALDLLAVLLAAALTLLGGRDRAPGPPAAKAAVSARAHLPSTEIGPEQPVSDPVYVDAAPWQADAQVAFDGTNYLVVWMDYRGYDRTPTTPTSMRHASLPTARTWTRTGSRSP